MKVLISFFSEQTLATFIMLNAIRTELRNATEDFSTANKIGEGGFGSVYKVTV
jgi:hypothetical protein